MTNIVSCVRKLFQIEKKFDVQPELLKGGARTEYIFTLFFYIKTGQGCPILHCYSYCT